MKKPIRTVKLETVEDIEALPEGEWVYVPDGIKFTWVSGDDLSSQGKARSRRSAAIVVTRQRTDTAKANRSRRAKARREKRLFGKEGK